MLSLMDRLFPICRSITGDGVRKTLRIIKETIDISINEVPTGTRVFDWTVPQEWNITEAWIKGSDDRKIVDFADNNLHVVGYSLPIRKVVSLEELKKHLFTLPEQPASIPYKTSYFRPGWGFCLCQNTYDELKEGDYEVCIESSLTNGHLTFGEYVLPGESAREIVLSTHICHPSMANDNLSGIALTTLLARHLSQADRKYTYRFLFVPGTIGSITWLAQNEASIRSIAHGLVVSCVGDPGPLTYKRSRRYTAEIDWTVLHALDETGWEYKTREFSPYGYDERQYSSPAFNLPFGSLTRTPNGNYPEYHTSADNLSLISETALGEAFGVCLRVFELLESARYYRNLNPQCEPQLGRRGLYSALGGRVDRSDREMAILYLLNYSDGENSLTAIAQRSGLAIRILEETAAMLVEHDLLEEIRPT